MFCKCYYYYYYYYYSVRCSWHKMIFEVLKSAAKNEINQILANANKCIFTIVVSDFWIFYKSFLFPIFTVLFFFWRYLTLAVLIAANDSLYPHLFLCLSELLSLHSAERLWGVVTSVAFCSLSELGYRQCLISHAVDDLLYSCPSEHAGPLASLPQC